MLAFDDAAMARLLIAATAVPRDQRKAWLQLIARKVEPPRPPSHARKQQRYRWREKHGLPSARRIVEQGEHRRRRRAEATRRWRARRRRGAACYLVEVDGETFDLICRFEKFDPSRGNDWHVVMPLNRQALLFINGARRP